MAQDGIQLITQIAISSHSPVTGKAIADQYKKLFPGYHEKLPIEAVEPQGPGAPIRIILGNNAEAGIDVMMMPTPIPPDMLTFAYAMNPHWPEARAELQRCRGHVAVIALQRQDGRDNPIRNAICLTLISACICNLVPAVGMFCPSGNALTPVRRLRELAAKMLTGEPPVEAWVQTIIADAPADKGHRRLTAMTNGLRMLVGREIEIMPVARDREKLLEAVRLLLRFTLERGTGFDEGDSVDMNDGNAACVRFASEGQRQGIPIFETRLVKLDAQRKLPPDAFGDKPLPPKQPRDRAAEQAATEPAEPVQEHERIFVAYVLLARPTQISAQMLTAAIRRRFPDFKGEYASIDGNQAANASGSTQMFVMRNTPIVMMSIDAPIPASNFANAMSAAEIVWPDIAKTVSQHQAHINVGILASAKDFKDAVQRAGDLTILTAALCDVVPALAVYWGAGDVVSKPENFQSGAELYLKGKPPVDRWLQLRLIRATTEDGRPGIGLVTTGLVPFLDREIEFLPAAVHPVIVGERVIGTAAYLLMNGPIIDHGQTTGTSKSESVRVRHLDRGRYSRRPVYELTLEVLDPAVSPNQPGYLKEVPKAQPDELAEAAPNSASVQPLRPAATAPVATPPTESAPELPPASPRAPKPAPDNAASRMVRNLRRPQS